MAIHVKASIAARKIGRHCRSAFEPKVKLGNTWNPRHVNPPSIRRLAGIIQRRKFVFRKRVAVECEPISQPGYPVAEVHTRAPVAWIFGATLVEGIPNGVTPQEAVPSQRARAACKNTRSRN